MDPELNQFTNALIHNVEFQDWMVRPTPEKDKYWKEFIAQNPQREKEMEEAITFIHNLIPEEKELRDEPLKRLWSRIEAETYKRKVRRIWRMRWIAAASFLLVLGIFSAIYLHTDKVVKPTSYYSSIPKIKPDESDIKLIFSDKSEEILQDRDVKIKYEKNGEILVNSDRKLKRKIEEGEKDIEQLNQLVVPFGKRTTLVLSDGTKLYLNSGSRAIFPVVFNKNEREIFIEGEAYLEVAHDSSRPFKVQTDKMKIEVLGTKFNVSAYSEDQSNSIVLVEGGVQATVDSKIMVMKPNQRLLYEKKTSLTSLDDANVLPYISWKDGWMYCEKESLESISVKLSRYYNVEIKFIDEESAKMSLTGKLDLKNKCADIFNAISSTAPIAVEIHGDVIEIRKKQ